MFNPAYGQRIVKQTCRGHPCLVLLESDVLYHLRVRKSECLEILLYIRKIQMVYKLCYIKQHQGKKISVALLVVHVHVCWHYRLLNGLPYIFFSFKAALNFFNFSKITRYYHNSWVYRQKTENYGFVVHLQRDMVVEMSQPTNNKANFIARHSDLVESAVPSDTSWANTEELLPRASPFLLLIAGAVSLMIEQEPQTSDVHVKTRNSCEFSCCSEWTE